MSKYNGWANYETWRINLEMLDGMTPEDFGFNVARESRDDIVNPLAESLEAYVGVIVEEQATGFALDLANSFLADVDWEEIAEHMVEDAIAELV